MDATEEIVGDEVRTSDEDDESGPPTTTTGLAAAYAMDPVLDEAMRQVRTAEAEREEYIK